MSDTDPRCLFCNEQVSKEDYCHGCGAYICDACDQTEPMKRLHVPEDHKLPAFPAVKKEAV